MNMKKIVALVLAVMMLVPALVSCNNDPAETKDTKPRDTTTNIDASSTTALVKETYKDIDFEGYNFRILSVDPGQHIYRLIDEETANEIYYEEANTENYDSAVYRRNMLTEELLHIEIVPIWGGNTEETPGQAKKLINMQNDDFDMSLMSLDKAMNLGMENYFYNLYDIDTFDISADWWDQDMVDTYSYAKHKLYVIAGDYTVCDDYAMPVIFYNKNVLSAYQLDDPAELVDAGTWTIDAMMKMAEVATKDNGNGTWGDEDNWGFTDNGDTALHLMEGAETLIAIPDEDGIPMVNCTSEAFLNAAEYIYNRVVQSPALWQGDNETGIEMMLQDRSLFYYEMLGCINQFRDYDGVFSLLPLPKLNEQQQEYTSVVNTVWASALSVPITAAENFDKIGTIMNVLGGFSTDTVDQTLYEVILGVKLIRIPETTRMLGYVLDSKAYDWGKEFGWANSIYKVLKEMRPGTAFTLASSLRGNIRSLQKQLLIFTKDIED